jgi:CheY-like chemotaxis protein
LVLLVDDEDVVRASTADMLMELGYSVEEAPSAEAALALLNDGIKPNLLVTDHLMPGMNGLELVWAIREHCPDLPALIVSGYAEADGLAPDMPRLTKPFRRSELAEKLGELRMAAAAN